MPRAATSTRSRVGLPAPLRLTNFRHKHVSKLIPPGIASKLPLSKKSLAPRPKIVEAKVRCLCGEPLPSGEGPRVDRPAHYSGDEEGASLRPAP